MKFPRILVKAPNWIGDAVMATPFLAAVRASWPKAHLAVLARARVRPVVERGPRVDAILDEPPRAPWAVACRLRGEAFDLSFNLSSSVGVAAALAAARVPVRVGFTGGGRGLFQTLSVKPPARTTHLTEHYLALALAAGARRPAAPRLAWRVDAADAREAARWLARAGVKGGEPVAAFAPGATYGPAKRWFTGSWARLADRLALDHGARVVVVGGPDEEATARRIGALAARPVAVAAGALTLGGTAALLARARVFVTNDSGLMHVGAAVGAATLALFGSSDPRWTGPQAPTAAALWGRVPCAPCFRRRCLPGRGYACLAALTPELVARRAGELLVA